MLKLINAVCEDRALSEFGGQDDFTAFLRACGAEGAEIIRCGDDSANVIPRSSVVGVHLPFYTDWVDFWRGDKKKLSEKFGSLRAAERFYGSAGPDCLLGLISADMDYAQSIGARYVVFHVSDVSLNETLTRSWEHTDREVIDASAQVLNALTAGRGYSFELLLENLPWKGFSFIDPELTAYMLSSVNYEKTAIMLDTGHLMCTCTALRTQADGVRYISDMLDAHKELAGRIRGIHLHQSLSGEYAEKALLDPIKLTGDYNADFTAVYSHVTKLDRHEPFSDPRVRSLVDRIGPEYLVHELAAKDRAEKQRLCRVQASALGML